MRLPWLLVPFILFTSALDAEDVQNVRKDTKADDMMFLEPSPGAIERKLKFLYQLSHSSPLIVRVEQSNCQDAQLLLQSAISSHLKGQQDFENNNLDSALEYADQGLRAMAAAARIVPDKAREKKAEQDRYEQIYEHVLGLRNTLKRIDVDASGEAYTDVNELIRKSEQLSKNGDYQLASDHLARVTVKLETALNVAYGNDTLVYELSFDTPEDEYHYEDRRNKEYITLIELLEQQDTLSTARIDVMAQAKEKNSRLRNEAEVLAKDNRFEAAIHKMEDATGFLANALRSAGLAVQ